MRPPKFQAVIFDMDGVLVDSEPRHQRAFEIVMAEMGYADTHGINFEDYLGKSDLILWRDFIEQHHPPQSLEELIDWRQSKFIEIIEREQPLFAGVEELVHDLHKIMPLAVASGSLHPVIQAVLGLKNLRQFFSAVVSSADVDRGKPAPDVFLQAASEIQVAPEEICVIEDSEAGVTAGRRAGMHVIAITNSLPASRLQEAHAIVESYAELRDYLGLLP